MKSGRILTVSRVSFSIFPKLKICNSCHKNHKNSIGSNYFAQIVTSKESQTKRIYPSRTQLASCMYKNKQTNNAQPWSIIQNPFYKQINLQIFEKCKDQWRKPVCKFTRKKIHDPGIGLNRECMTRYCLILNDYYLRFYMCSWHNRSNLRLYLYEYKYLSIS